MKSLNKILVILLALTLLFALVAVSASASSAPSEPDYDDGYEDVYEDPVIDNDSLLVFSEAGARAYLFIVGLLLGIALPAVPLVIFLIKVIRKRAECETVDYVVLGISAAWLAVGIALFMMLL